MAVEQQTLTDLVLAEYPAAPATATMAEHLREPRPDLTTDTDRWRQLLGAAFERSGMDPDGVFGVLHGVRCCGARLLFQRGQWRIVPWLEAARDSAAWATDEEWQETRQRWLLPHREAIAELLRGLAP